MNEQHTPGTKIDLFIELFLYILKFYGYFYKLELLLFHVVVYGIRIVLTFFIYV